MKGGKPIQHLLEYSFSCSLQELSTAALYSTEEGPMKPVRKIIVVRVLALAALLTISLPGSLSFGRQLYSQPYSNKAGYRGFFHCG